MSDDYPALNSLGITPVPVLAVCLKSHRIALRERLRLAQILGRAGAGLAVLFGLFGLLGFTLSMGFVDRFIGHARTSPEPVQVVQSLWWMAASMYCCIRGTYVLFRLQRVYEKEYHRVMNGCRSEKWAPLFSLTAINEDQQQLVSQSNDAASTKTEMILLESAAKLDSRLSLRKLLCERDDDDEDDPYGIEAESAAGAQVDRVPLALALEKLYVWSTISVACLVLIVLTLGIGLVPVGIAYGLTAPHYVSLCARRLAFLDFTLDSIAK